ncbi:hypothetical protein Dimus_027831 [Dionaea muscipula]
MSYSVISSSQSIFIATAAAMAVSGAVILLSLSRQRTSPSLAAATTTTSQFHQTQNHPPLRSCLSSDGKRKERRTQKRVKFAEDVKEKSGKAAKKEQRRRPCRSEVPAAVIHGMPANRVALYHGILRDRVYRIQCSYS